MHPVTQDADSAFSSTAIARIMLLDTKMIPKSFAKCGLHILYRDQHLISPKTQTEFIGIVIESKKVATLQQTLIIKSYACELFSSVFDWVHCVLRHTSFIISSTVVRDLCHSSQFCCWHVLTAGLCPVHSGKVRSK